MASNVYRALYDHTGTEPQMLTFKAGDTLTLVSKAGHPWWECKLGDALGFAPFNYIAPPGADSGTAGWSGQLGAEDGNALDDGGHDELTDDEDECVSGATAPAATLEAAAPATSTSTTTTPRSSNAPPASPNVTHIRIASSSAPSTERGSTGSLRTKMSPNKAAVERESRPRSRSFLGSRTQDEILPSNEPAKRGHERRSSTGKTLLGRRSSGSRPGSKDSLQSSDASGESSPVSALRANALARPRGAQCRVFVSLFVVSGCIDSPIIATVSSSVRPQLFGLPLQVVMPSGHSPPMFLVRLLATLEASRGIETPGIFLTKCAADQLAPLKARLNFGDASCIATATDPHLLAGVLQEWLECLPLSVIPADMYNLVCEAEKIHNDDAHFFHCVHTLIHSMPKAHRVALQYVCYIFKNAVACSDRNGTTLDKLAPVMAPVLLRPRDGTSRLVINQAGGTARMQRFATLRNVDITSLHIDELPPVESATDVDVTALLQAELDRRAHTVVAGARVVHVLIDRFGEMFMNEGLRNSFLRHNLFLALHRNSGLTHRH